MNDMPNGTAPEGDAFRMGSRGGRTGQAWQHVWNHLSATDYQDGTLLAERAGEACGVKANSVTAHLRLAVREGWLATENRFVDVPVTKGGVTRICKRKRTFYRIGSRALASAGR